MEETRRGMTSPSHDSTVVLLVQLSEYKFLARLNNMQPSRSAQECRLGPRTCATSDQPNAKQAKFNKYMSKALQ